MKIFFYIYFRQTYCIIILFYGKNRSKKICKIQILCSIFLSYASRMSRRVLNVRRAVFFFLQLRRLRKLLAQLRSNVIQIMDSGMWTMRWVLFSFSLWPTFMERLSCVSFRLGLGSPKWTHAQFSRPVLTFLRYFGCVVICCQASPVFGPRVRLVGSWRALPVEYVELK